MGRYQIEEKSNTFLKEHDPFRGECDVVYLLIEIRKILDHENNNKYPILRFYSDWAVHTEKDKITKEIKKVMPELAQDKVKKFIEKHKIKKEDAEILAAEKELAEMFEKVAEEINPVLAAKWLRRELVRVLNYNKKELHEVEIDEKHMIGLLKLVENKKITDNVAAKLLEKLVEKPFDVKEYVKKEGLEAVSDVSELEKYCKEAIRENSKAVEDYKKGEKRALNFIVGVIMKKTRGKATPKKVNEIILRLIREE